MLFFFGIFYFNFTNLMKFLRVVTLFLQLLIWKFLKEDRKLWYFRVCFVSQSQSTWKEFFIRKVVLTVALKNVRKSMSTTLPDIPKQFHLNFFYLLCKRKQWFISKMIMKMHQRKIFTTLAIRFFFLGITAIIWQLLEC